MQRSNIVFGVLFLINVFTHNTQAQDVENDFQSRTSLGVSFKPVKKFKINLSPEFRFNENFELSRYHIETEAQYKINKSFRLGGSYRYVINPRESKDTEYLSRYMLGLTMKKKLSRTYWSLRVAYSNNADDESKNSSFLRYKIGFNYDIADCRISPVGAFEGFEQTTDFEIYKWRTTFGADYKLFKKNYLSFRYKFDYYRTAYRNKHIVSIGYKIKF